MPGLLNNLFGANESSESGSSQYDAEAYGGLDLSPTVGVSHSAEASWEDPEGTTDTYESDTDLVFTADVDATFAAATSLIESGAEDA